MADHDAGGSGSSASSLVVSGGGAVRVSTDQLIAHALALDAVAEGLLAAGGRLAALDRLVSATVLVEADAPLSALRAEAAIDTAMTELAHTAEAAADLATLLRLGADAYGAAEHAVAALAQGVVARAAHGLGLVLGSFGMLALGLSLPLLAGGAAGLAAAAIARPDGFQRLLGAAGGRLSAERAAVSSPLVVSATRLAVMSADDLGTGVLRLPPPLAALLGDEGLRILGLGTSATVLTRAAAGVGLFTETPVGVRAVATAITTPATGFADRAARIPTLPAPQEPSPQIRIDRYSEPGRPDSFEVYLGGTLDFSPVATDEPWDLTSNVRGIAGSDAAGSYRAVEEALAAAGATPESSVVVTGYSQGGLVGAMLAASDDHTVTGLYTLGAPAAQVPVPAEVPWVAVEHSDDMVPALGGTWTSIDPVVVRREVFADGPVESDLVFPAHELGGYRDSAAMLDAAVDPRIGGVRSALDRGSPGVTVESTWFEATREPDR